MPLTTCEKPVTKHSLATPRRHPRNISCAKRSPDALNMVGRPSDSQFVVNGAGIARSKPYPFSRILCHSVFK